MVPLGRSEGRLFAIHSSMSWFAAFKAPEVFGALSCPMSCLATPVTPSLGQFNELYMTSVIVAQLFSHVPVRFLLQATQSNA